MKEEDAEKLLSKGEIFIGNYKFYKTVENKSIIDPTEGYKSAIKIIPKEELKIKIGPTKDKDGNIVETKEEDKKLIEFLDVKFGRMVRYPDSYIYCTSLCSDKNLFDGYNSCIEITNEDAFLRLIGLELYSRGLCENIVNSWKIVYVKHKEVDYRNPLPAYWIKELAFEKEQEYRSVFRTKVKDLNVILKPQLLQIPDLKIFCKRIW